MSDKATDEGFDIFRGLETGGFTFRGVDPQGGATFEHACGEIHRIGPGAHVSLIALTVRTHKCSRAEVRQIPRCDLCGKPATRRDNGSDGWHLNYCDDCGGSTPRA